MVVLLAFAGCKDSRQQLVENAPYISVTLTDSYGVRVRFAQPPQRLFVLSPNQAECLYAIGAQDRIGAVSPECDYPEAVRSKPTFVTEPELDLKALLEEKPDGVIVNDEVVANSDIYRRIFQAFGLPVLFQRYRTVSDISGGIRQLGELTQRTDAANLLADSLTQVAQRFREATAQRTPVKVVILLSDNPLMVAGGDHYLTDVLAHVGGSNPFAGRKALFAKLSPVELLAAQPDAIWVLNADPDLLKRLSKVEPRVMNLPAVQKERVYRPEDLQPYFRPGPRVGTVLADLAHFLHPDLDTRKLLEAPVER